MVGALVVGLTVGALVVGELVVGEHVCMLKSATVENLKLQSNTPEMPSLPEISLWRMQQLTVS